MLAWKTLLDTFHRARVEELQSIIPLDANDQTEKKFILPIWDDYVAARDDDVRDLYGATRALRK